MLRYRKAILTYGFSLLSLFWLLAASAGQLPDFTGLVKENSPAVVNISTTQNARGPRLPPGVGLPDLPEDSPGGGLLRKFFGEGGSGKAPVYETTSLGSGFIIDPSGYIVTNYHVVKDADEITVRLRDRQELSAQIVGSDERSDLALLKVTSKKALPVVRLGHSSQLQVGEWVFAIGSPFGFDHSVSVGVVSAIGRSLPSETYIPFIQTDVAINPGNSGGPLFNMRGEVVGINSQIYSRTGGFMGVSFAIPVDTAMDVIAQIKATGHVTRGWLGVLIQDVNQALAESFGLKKPMGALVLKVIPDSPAAQAGFKVGDVVVEYAHKPIVYSSDLPVVVGETHINAHVRVKVIRHGKPVWLRVRIGELPERPTLALQAPPKVTGHDDPRLGLVLGDIDKAQRSALELDQGGVMVKEVKPGSAFDAGIRPGDVIVMLNNQPVRDVRHLLRLSQRLPEGDSVPVLVQRRSGPLFLALRLSGKRDERDTSMPQP